MTDYSDVIGIFKPLARRSRPDRTRDRLILVVFSLFLILASGMTGPSLGFAAEPTLDQQAETYFKQGELLLEIQQYLEAVEAFTKVVSIHASIGKQEPQYSEAHRKRAIAYHGLKNYREAMKDFDLAVKINPANCRAWLGRGLVRNLTKDHQGAITDYNQALQIDPNYANAYLNRGSAKIYLNDPDGAINDYLKAVELDSKNVDALVGLGLAFTKLKRYDEAGRNFSRVLELAPDNTTAQKNLEQIKPFLTSALNPVGVTTDTTQTAAVTPPKAASTVEASATRTTAVATETPQTTSVAPSKDVSAVDASAAKPAIGTTDSTQPAVVT
ncbi:MAG: tetratricopeptide repeat protein, partial [Deltaproteobacteria bacterium]|nr:tetratricopeptide repeat protein [Deltaproteobacteria bacterium]